MQLCKNRCYRRPDTTIFYTHCDIYFLATSLFLLLLFVVFPLSFPPIFAIPPKIKKKHSLLILHWFFLFSHKMKIHRGVFSNYSLQVLILFIGNYIATFLALTSFHLYPKVFLLKKVFIQWRKWFFVQTCSIQNLSLKNSKSLARESKIASFFTNFESPNLIGSKIDSKLSTFYPKYL